MKESIPDRPERLYEGRGGYPEEMDPPSDPKQAYMAGWAAGVQDGWLEQRDGRQMLGGDKSFMFANTMKPHYKCGYRDGKDAALERAASLNFGL